MIKYLENIASDVKTSIDYCNQASNREIRRLPDWPTCPRKVSIGIGNYYLDRSIVKNRVKTGGKAPRKNHGFAEITDGTMEIKLRQSLPDYMKLFISFHELCHLCFWKTFGLDKNYLYNEVVADFSAMCIWNMIDGDYNSRQNYLGKIVTVPQLIKGYKGSRHDKANIDNALCDAETIVPIIMSGRLF